MLVEFTLKNYLSFRNEDSFSMLAAKSVKEHEGNDSKESCNIIRMPDSEEKILKVAAIYGANGSGKSNLLSAMQFFKKMVLESFTNDCLLKKNREITYQFSVESAEEPSSFEMMFIVGDIRYRYGFEIKGKSIDTEWLFLKPISSIRESYCFIRDKKSIKVNSKTFKGAGGVGPKTRHDSLFLSTCAQFNVGIAMDIKTWFRKRFNILSGLDSDTLHYTANQYLQNEKMRKLIIDFIKIIDLGIHDIHVRESELKHIPEPVNKLINVLSTSDASDVKNRDFRMLEIQSEHKRYECEHLKDTVITPFTIESFGTKKIFALLGPWFDTILNGGVLMIDEFGASFHTKLSIELIKLFQSSMNSDAQLIVATHDTNLLRGDLLRRDQVWFTEKNQYGVSDLYSLVEYKINQATSVRNDANLNKDYLMGKYGAIPYFGDISRFLADFTDGK